MRKVVVITRANVTRKKLRLTREQTFSLGKSFEEHVTLSQVGFSLSRLRQHHSLVIGFCVDMASCRFRSRNWLPD